MLSSFYVVNKDIEEIMEPWFSWFHHFLCNFFEFEKKKWEQGDTFVVIGEKYVNWK